MRLSAFRFLYLPEASLKNFLRSCSPDGAQRNPGSAFKLVDRPRISLRSIRATGPFAKLGCGSASRER